MSRDDLAITVQATITRGTAKPIVLSWKVTAGPDESAETIVPAVTEACRLLHSALKETVK